MTLSREHSHLHIAMLRFLPATVKFMINMYRNDHLSSWLDLIHIKITVPVARADKILQINVGMVI